MTPFTIGYYKQLGSGPAKTDLFLGQETIAAGTILGVYGAPATDTIYAQIRNASNQIWNGSSFETYADAHWTTYALALSEQGTSGYFTLAFPSNIIATGQNTLITLDEYYVYAGVSANSALDPTRVLNITDASDLIQNYVDRQFIPQTIIEVLNGNNDSLIHPQKGVPDTLVGLTLNYGCDEPIEVPLSYLGVSSDGAVFFKANSALAYYNFPLGYQNIQLIYQVYADVPPTVKRACAELATYLGKRMQVDPAVKSLGVKDQSKSFGDIEGIPAFIREQLGKYRDHKDLILL